MPSPGHSHTSKAHEGHLPLSTSTPSPLLSRGATFSQNNSIGEVLWSVRSMSSHLSLKSTTDPHILRVGIFGSLNPEHPWLHAGSIQLKLHYKAAEGKLWVYIVSGSDLDSKDDNGLSDPFIEFSIGKLKKRTQVVKKDLNPSFEEEMEFDIAPPLDGRLPDLKMVVWDWDRVGKNDLIGGATIPVSSLSPNSVIDAWVFINGKYNFNTNSFDHVSLSFLPSLPFSLSRKTLFPFCCLKFSF